MVYPSREARDAALGRDATARTTEQAALLQPLLSADGRQVVVRVECTHPPLDTRTIAWGIVRGWVYVVLIVVGLGLLLAAVGVGLD